MTIDRRSILTAAGAAALAALTDIDCSQAADGSGGPATPTPENDATRSVAPPAPSPQFAEALKTIVGDKQLLDERVKVELPEVAENGNIVPYKLDVESPMTAEDNITKLYLLSTQNPQAKVAVFHFTLTSGKAAVTGRMRLAKTQDVIAIAETNTGEFLRGTCNVEVTIGGCSNE